MRIIQLTAAISDGDAISNDVLAIDRILRNQGYDAQIYSEFCDGQNSEGVSKMLCEIPKLSDDDVIIYHGDTGSVLIEMLQSMKGRKILRYHNATPPSYYSNYSTYARKLAKTRLHDIFSLAEKMDYCLATSEYNKRDLLKMGFNCPIEVCLEQVPFEQFSKEPDRAILERYDNDETVNLLFVGRVAPDKKQEDIIRAFYYYHKLNSDSRLFLVGSWRGMELYYERLKKYAELLGLKDSVFFTGHIEEDELLAYYRIADAFICMSEHEGFCVPLVEAMYFHIPIIAYNSTAVSETLREAGILLPDKIPQVTARVIDRVIRDGELREYLNREQDKRIAYFTEKTSENILLSCIRKIQTKPVSRKPRIMQFVTSIHRGDGVSNDVFAFQNVILSMEYPTGIYTEQPTTIVGWDNILSLSELPELREEDLVIFHHAIGTQMIEKLLALPCKKAMVYHNVTPPEFYRPYSENAAQCCEGGLRDLEALRGKMDYTIADSEFNKQDLLRVGYEEPVYVCPILIPFSDYEKEPDIEIIRRYSDGKPNILFVGRIVPNKKIEDIISAFASFKRKEPQARLFLVGTYEENGRYYRFLQEHVRKLGVEDVFFSGHTSFEEILAYYRVATMFLCMSEHEGFCIPLLESMCFDIPILAYASTAVPETLGESGILFDKKEFDQVALKMAEICRNESLRKEIIIKQRKRLCDFSYENIVAKVEDTIKSMVDNSK